MDPFLRDIAKDRPSAARGVGAVLNQVFASAVRHDAIPHQPVVGAATHVLIDESRIPDHVPLVKASPCRDGRIRTDDPLTPRKSQGGPVLIAPLVGGLTVFTVVPIGVAGCCTSLRQSFSCSHLQ
ncbi:hypothetical protein [Micromonospora aurantiaca (nom. illeg.)]|uniref:hypothetical protein n=1 Tax=Micromonospora aurantiaca (nom. illeg.) TaxID=47850 RepID=UPI003F53EF59